MTTTPTTRDDSRPHTAPDGPPDAPDDDEKRSQDRPLTDEEKLEVGIEDSMDASDPPAVVAPGDDGEPRPSSGFTE